MVIAQVSPLFESVPPKLYGGTERVVQWLTDELVRQGHEVILFASGDSVTLGKLIASTPQALRLSGDGSDALAHHFVMLERVFRSIHEFDVTHFHVDYLHYPLSRLYRVPHVSTLHGRLDIPDLVSLYQEYREMPVVSISNAQRRPLPWLNWLGTVYHGMPPDLFSFKEGPGKYLAFLGRISPEKGVERAIRIARQVGMPLKIAAKVDKGDKDYFDTTVRPLLSEPGIEYVGEIGQHEKNDFLGDAVAMLFPIDWPEPFGLVMIEAMACGTPVVAFRNGSVPEIMFDGLTGIICESVEQAVECFDRVAALSRRKCREVFETRFTSERMTRDYLRLYTKTIERHAKTSQRAVRGGDGRDLEASRLVPDPGHLVPGS